MPGCQRGRRVLRRVVVDCSWMRSVRQGCVTGLLGKCLEPNGLLAYDGPMEAEHGSLMLKADSTSWILVEVRNTSYGRAFLESFVSLCMP